MARRECGLPASLDDGAFGEAGMFGRDPVLACGFAGGEGAMGLGVAPAGDGLSLPQTVMASGRYLLAMKINKLNTRYFVP
jgi:hypothetical protein